MKSTRREFMAAIGVALGSLLAARCGRTSCYIPAEPTPAVSMGEDWDALRQPWQDLDLLARDAQDLEKGEQTLGRLIADHRAALDTLVRSGELDPAVADDMQLAFTSAAQHVWRLNAPITCYIPAPYPDYHVASSSDLAQQAELLGEMAARSDIDPATVEQARAAIERDIAFLSMSGDEQQALIDAVVQAVGEGGDYPSLAELDLDAPPESVEAARALVALLLGQP